MAGDEEKKVGFESIGKRIESLKEDIIVKDTANPQKETKKPQQTKPESDIKQESTPKTSTTSTTQKGGSSFTVSFGKLFWVIIAIVILVSFFSQDNDKKKTNYSRNNNAPAQRSVSPTALPSDKYVSTYGKFRCSSYQHNMAQTLLPRLNEKQDIEELQNFIKSEGNELDQLNTQIEITHVNNYSQSSVDYHNMLVNDYNSKLETYKINAINLQRKIDSYSAKIADYNNYLMANCKKAY